MSRATQQAGRRGEKGFEANRNQIWLNRERHADAEGGSQLREYREKCAGKNRDASDQEKQVLKQEAGFREIMESSLILNLR